MPEKQRRQPPRNVKLKPKENRPLALKSNGETKGPWKPQQTLRVHLGHVLDGGGNAEVVALGVLELAADALDLVLAGARPKLAQRARICLKKKKSTCNPNEAAVSRQTNPVQQRHSVERLECNPPRRDRDAAVEGAGEREPRRVSTRSRLAAAAAIGAGLGLSVVGGVGSGAERNRGRETAVFSRGDGARTGRTANVASFSLTCGGHMCAPSTLGWLPACIWRQRSSWAGGPLSGDTREARWHGHETQV